MKTYTASGKQLEFKKFHLTKFYFTSLGIEKYMYVSNYQTTIMDALCHPEYRALGIYNPRLNQLENE